MKNISVISIFLAVFLVLPVFADRVAMPRLSMPTAASSGFGGTHVAYTDNVFSLLVNPAAMMNVQQRSFFTIAPSIMSPENTMALSRSIFDLVGGNTEALGDMADTLSAQGGQISLGLELRELPLSIAWVANGFGFGLWNHTFVNFNIIGTNVEAHVYSDFMIPIGFAFRILDLGNHTIDAGLTLKPFARIRIQEWETIPNLISDSGDFIDQISAPVITGGGLDIGLLYRWDIGLQAGLTFTDVFSRGTVAGNLTQVEDNRSFYIPFAVNAGVSYSIRLGNILGIAVAADWRNIGNAFNQDDYLNTRNFVLDFGVGAELSLINTFFFRLGMNEMLPAIGLGIRLGAVNFDLAYYGREFGNEPGQLSVATVDLSISVRPGARERNWAWTRGSVLGLAGIGN